MFAYSCLSAHWQHTVIARFYGLSTTKHGNPWTRVTIMFQWFGQLLMHVSRLLYKAAHLTDCTFVSSSIRFTCLCFLPCSFQNCVQPVAQAVYAHTILKCSNYVGSMIRGHRCFFSRNAIFLQNAINSLTGVLCRMGCRTKMPHCQCCTVRCKITFYPVAMDIEIWLLTVVVREHVDIQGHCAIYNWLYQVFDQLRLYSGCLRSNITTDRLPAKNSFADVKLANK